MFSKFLHQLASRRYSENDLSDIIYVACETSDVFKSLFIQFFFPEISVPTDVYIEREYSQGNCRVDFMLEYEGEIYLIENKIYDRNHHFGDYDKVYKVTPDHFGYITNYDLFSKKKYYQERGYRIHTWEELYHYLLIYSGKDLMIDPILTYIKSTCSIITINQPMRISSLTSLAVFLEILKKIFNAETERYYSEYYDRNCMQETSWGGNIVDQHNNCVVGRYFQVTFNNIKKSRYCTSWGWMGIYFDNPESKPVVCIGIRKDRNWSGKAYDLIFDDLRNNSEWYSESNVVWRNLPDDQFEKLETLKSIDEQKEILYDFYVSSLEYIADLIDKK